MNLPKLRKAIEGDLPIASKGLIATWRESFTTLKRQKQDPAYYFRPELPDSANAYLPVDVLHTVDKVRVPLSGIATRLLSVFFGGSRDLLKEGFIIYP